MSNAQASLVSIAVLCRLCGSPGTQLFRSNNSHGSVSDLDHALCPNCGGVFISTPVTNEQLGEAYASLGMGRYYDETLVEHRKKMACALLEFVSFLPKDARIIDVGTGNGLFPEMIQDAGYENVSAHDIPGQDLTRLTARGIRVYQDYEYETLPENHFDAVTLMDVAEHVPSPLVLFAACFRMLRPGGQVYIHAPVVTRLDRAMHRLLKTPLRKVAVAWLCGRTSIFHLENYTVKAFELVLGQAGFCAILVKCRNELSWPVSLYVRGYVLDQFGVPRALSPILLPTITALAYPLIATRLNANKGIVQATKPKE